MKHPKTKIILTLLLTILFVAVFVVTLMIQNAAVIRLSSAKNEALKTDAISSAAEGVALEWRETQARIEALFRINDELSAWSADTGEEEEAQASAIAALVEENVNFQGIMLKPEAVCGGYALLVMASPAPESGYHIVYKNHLIPDGSELEKAGLTMEAIRKNAGQKEHTLILKDTAYEYSVSDIPDLDGYLVMLTPKVNLFTRSLSRATYTYALFILLLTGIAVAGCSLCGYVRSNVLTAGKKQKYRPGNIRRLALIYGVIGVLLIAGSGWLDQSLNRLYDFSVRSREVLKAAERTIEMNAECNSRGAQVVERIYLAYGSKIAAILNDRPEMCSGEALTSLAETIQASSITLYDSQGKETASSGDYIDLELGRDPASATWEFRRILKGTGSIFREAETDEQTGLNEVRLGIRINDPSGGGKHGAMIIALPPSILEHDAGEETNRILREMTTLNGKLWISDLETGIVTASGDRELIGKNIYDLGMTENDMRDALMRELRTDSGTCYLASSILGKRTGGETENGEGQIAFYSEDLDASNYGLSSIIISCFAFAALYALLEKVALSGYTDEFFNEYSHGSIRAHAGAEENSTAEGDPADLSGLSMIWKKIRNAWSALSPGRKGMLAVECLSILFLLQQIPLTSAGKGYAKDSVYYHITTGNWSRGVNLFALAAIMTLAAEILFSVIVVRLLLKGLSALSGTKGKTICRLISSFVRYIALITFLIMGLTYLGVSRTTIIAGVGALSFAVSMGAQSLVSDLISGIAIVFEGTYQVGDRVTISGCTGNIMEIGIRSTKILENDSDIVTVFNSHIGQVVNMTKHNSWYQCNITVSSSLDIEEIERMLNEELPKIGEREEQILSGPFYRGITAFVKGSMTLSIETECTEEDYDDVQLKVNRELQLLFRKKGISI